MLRKTAYVAGALGGVVLIAFVALWWRLANGPIELDLATPWLTAAIEENFGSDHQVEVGGTQLERDANGRTALRMRDIVVRDRDGTVVASAPKAEVGVSGVRPVHRPRTRRTAEPGRRRDAGAHRDRQQGHGIRRRQQAPVRDGVGGADAVARRARDGAAAAEHERVPTGSVAGRAQRRSPILPRCSPGSTGSAPTASTAAT